MNLIFFNYLGSLLLSWGWLFLQRRCDKATFPNQRSSHTIPTPQGGGVAIAIVAIISLCLLSTDGRLIEQVLLLMPLCLVTLTGYLDDFHALSGRWKLGLIALSVLPLVYLMVSAPIPYVEGMIFFAIFAVLFFLGLIWVVNLTNFMDGINGIATLQAIFMLVATWYFRDALSLSVLTVEFIACVGVACLAFLPFNFPKARLFLGDTGSLFLGTLMAWVLLLMMLNHSDGLWAFLTLFAMFWVDATITLLRRLWRGKSIFEAHREHAYQHLANERFGSHTKATLLIQAVNYLWLLPMASMVLHAGTWQLLWLAIALMPVIVYSVVLRAGLPWIKNTP